MYVIPLESVVYYCGSLFKDSVFVAILLDIDLPPKTFLFFGLSLWKAMNHCHELSHVMGCLISWTNSHISSCVVKVPYQCLSRSLRPSCFIPSVLSVLLLLLRHYYTVCCTSSLRCMIAACIEGLQRFSFHW